MRDSKEEAKVAQEIRIGQLMLIFQQMTDEQKVDAFNTLRWTWCRHCGGKQPERIGGCRCEDDS
jgi:hypothetical protein